MYIYMFEPWLVDMSYDAMYAATSALRARSLSANSLEGEHAPSPQIPLPVLVESPKVSKTTAGCTLRLLTDVLFTRRCRRLGVPRVSATCGCQPRLHLCSQRVFASSFFRDRHSK